MHNAFDDPDTDWRTQDGGKALEQGPPPLVVRRLASSWLKGLVLAGMRGSQKTSFFPSLG